MTAFINSAESVPGVRITLDSVFAQLPGCSPSARRPIILDPVEAELDGWVGPDSDLLLWLHVASCSLPHDGVDGGSPSRSGYI